MILKRYLRNRLANLPHISVVALRRNDRSFFLGFSDCAAVRGDPFFYKDFAPTVF